MNFNDFVRKYKSNIKYNTSLVLSEIVAPFGSFAGAYLFDVNNFNRYFSSGAGGLIGNYVSAVITFGTAWYLLNWNVYSNNSTKFFKEFGEMTAKNLVPAGISYLVYSPIAAAFTYKSFEPAEAAFYASILSAAIFIAGSNIINQRIIKSHNL